MAKTCFVIMPIGDQHFGDHEISASALKARYTDLIREALLAADPTLQIMRADEVSAPGVVSTDIITRLMHSIYVVADVTYPNPNVFYELGLRHACRVGTIIIRERSGPRVPFDISHLRYIEYENTPTGLKQLSQRFRECFAHFESNPNSPDSQFQDLAKLTKYKFPDYSTPEDHVPPEAVALMAMMRSPEVLDLVIRQSRGEEIDRQDIMRAIISNPDLAGVMTLALVKSGNFNLFGKDVDSPDAPKPNRSTRRNQKKKR